MKRRAVLALLAGATMPLPFAAGEPAMVFRLGMLSFTPPGPGIRALKQRLQTLGWEEGRNPRIDYVQLDDADTDRSLAMAAELVGRGVDAIYDLRTQKFQYTTIQVTYNTDVNDNNDFFSKVRNQLGACEPVGRDIFVLTDWMAAKMAVISSAPLSLF